jgi:hypothetical protein
MEYSQYVPTKKGGPLPFYCQASSLELASQKLPSWSSGTTFQVGHWISGNCKYLAYFEATHVGFVELKPGSGGLVEMATGTGSFFIGQEQVYGITTGQATGPWRPVPMNTWIPCTELVFRITSLPNAAVVVHMHVPNVVQYALEHFVAGSNSIWTHDVTFYFTPSSKKYEHKRTVPCELSARAKQFLLCEADDDVDTIPDTMIPQEIPETVAVPAVPATEKQDALRDHAMPLTLILHHAKHI